FEAEMRSVFDREQQLVLHQEQTPQTNHPSGSIDCHNSHRIMPIYAQTRRKMANKVCVEFRPSMVKAGDFDRFDSQAASTHHRYQATKVRTAGRDKTHATQAETPFSSGITQRCASPSHRCAREARFSCAPLSKPAGIRT